MIGRLKGIVLEKKPPFLLLDVHGVGYDIETSMNTFYQLPDMGQDTTLSIHVVIREDAQLLFGFINDQERSLFRHLIKVNGVGPKMALAILSTMNGQDFVCCIEQQDLQQLVRIPGVGKKTAERLCVEMRDRLQDWQLGLSQMPTEMGAEQMSANRQVNDAIDALAALGYKISDAKRMITQLDNGNLSSEQLIRLSLQQLHTKT